MQDARQTASLSVRTGTPYVLTPAEAVAKALTFLKVIEGKKFEYPVFFDIEEQNALATGKKNVSAIIRAFCGEMEKAGYWVYLIS